ncbi:hypothetical protein [Streptomyces sp. NRRL S-4]|uniref:COG4315 family predicted lipoprotein n=2 Tax=unclassified Streptomyces TaxID=2593676 RepID=UPI0006B62763|nr:hypothetical protein [Streptomyces sp. NRRL S-4]KPC84038.1 hypothetical protein ADK82_05640 [Streptomyces sp. NRRL S-4]
MRRHTKAAAALASAVLMAATAAGCSDNGSGSGSARDADGGVQNGGRQVDVPAAPSKSPTATVSVRNGTYGTSLVDDKGMTLYVFDKDTKNKSNCADACAKEWPPLLDEAPTAGSGVKSNLLKTTTRGDGKRQVTYNGHALYRFDEDQKAGDTNGQAVDAFGAKWYVISPEGKQITTKPTSNTGNGY